MKPDTTEPSWKWRRSIIFTTVGFCFYEIDKLTLAQDTQLNQTISWGLILLAGSLILGYTGLSAVQDVMFKKYDADVTQKAIEAQS